MSVFTQVGAGIWSWDPFRRLCRSHDDIVGRCTKLFWLALYTAPEAKLVTPGLWFGSITTMSEAAGLQADEALVYLDRLLEDEMVEYDRERRVLRLTQLPDHGESPKNGNTLRGWWRKFQTVPACAVRDAHVSTLRWIMDEWSRVQGKPISPDHQSAWDETFGRLPVPAPRRRGVRRLLDADTSTAVQPSLFGPQLSADSGLGNRSETVAVGRHEPASGPEVCRSADLNKINYSETVREPFGNEREKDRDHDHDHVLSGEGGSGGGHDPGTASSSRPRLVLVPDPNAKGTTVKPFCVADLVPILGLYRSQKVDQRDAIALLESAIERCLERGLGADDLAILAAYSSAGGLNELAMRVPKHVRTEIAWWAAEDRLYNVLVEARQWRETSDAFRSDLADALAKAGIKI